MARLTTLPAADTVKIGTEAQSPLKSAAKHRILYLNIEQKTVDDLRKGL